MRVPLTNKCLVLDLDETLVHSNGEREIDPMKILEDLQILTDPRNYDLRERTYKVKMEDVMNKRGEGAKMEIWGVFRPHVKEFLINCFKYFKIVIIWSAGLKNYVHAIVDRLFADVGHRPHIIWTRDDIETLHNKTLIKPLNKLIEKVPGLNKYMSLENTFIIDDRSSVFHDSNPDNGIQIPAYNPSSNLKSLRDDDTYLIQLYNWFMKPEVMNAQDVRLLDKKKIFEVSPVISNI